MDEHCAMLEAEVTSDHAGLARSLDYLESSVRGCLKEFDQLKEHGIMSLAPPVQALPRPGTKAAIAAQADSMVAPGALLRAIDKHMQSPSKGTEPMLMPPSPDALTNDANAPAMLMNQPTSPSNSQLALGNAPSNAPNVANLQQMLASNVPASNAPAAIG